MERFLGKGARDIDLSVDYGTSQADLKIIQLDLLYDDHCYAFLFTFAISVIAAVYGVTKFFRFSYSRHCDKLVKSNLTITGEREEYKNQGLNIISFLMTFTMSGMYLCGKALALAAFMWVNENTMGQNVAWWVFFCMIPSFIFALAVIFGRTCYKTDHQCLKGYPVYNNWSFRIFFKAPAVIGIPTVTPFTYKTKTVGVTRIEDLDDDDKRYMQHESMVAYFVLGYRLSYINNLLTIFFTSIGLMTIAHLETVLVGTISTIFFVVTTIFFYLIMKLDNKGSERCPEHGKKKLECTHCAEEYGVYIKDYLSIEVCKAHRVPNCSYCIQLLEMNQS